MIYKFKTEKQGSETLVKNLKGKHIGDIKESNTVEEILHLMQKSYEAGECTGTFETKRDIRNLLGL